ncbi:hypothetical protein HZA40_00830 [Candidatus Peregrinibacteria bacterium]|nr:hypothetical protein [Candidatus Peregrinibacteria bacterium]
MENIFLLLMLISIACLFIGRKKPECFKSILKDKATKKDVTIIFGIIAGVFFVLFGIVTNRNEPVENTAINQHATSTQAPAIQIPQYEIVKKGENNSIINLDIFTQSKDDNAITLLNDKLVNDYAPDYVSFLMIRYFDDQNIAKTYDDQLGKAGDNEKEADKLFSHWSYELLFNRSTGKKELLKNVNNDWVSLKKY